MDIKNYINILWRRKWIIVTTLLVTMAVVVIGTWKMTPIYSATTTMRIALAATGSVSYQDYMYGDRLMNTYVRLATTVPVLDELKQKLGISSLPTIEVKTVPTTELMQITVRSADAVMSASIANNLANILLDQSIELYAGGGESSLELLRQQVSSMEQEVNQAQTDYENLVADNPTDAEAIQKAKDLLDVKQELYTSLLEQYEQTRLKSSQRANSIMIVEPASPPVKPYKPNKLLNVGLGFVVGFIGGIGLAFLFENLDTTLYTTEQIESVTKLPTIGKVPRMKKKNSFNDLNGNFGIGEAFRRLRTNILAVNLPIRTLLITSAEPKEGKSRIVANIAYIMAQSGRAVIVIDADLRVPTQDKLFNVDSQIGLSSVLEQKVLFTQAIQTSEFQGVSVIPSGPIPDNPSELLGSDQMGILIDKLTKIFDMVIIDTPAALAVADAAIIAPLADAIALVIYRSKTSSKAVQSTLGHLNKVNNRIIGAIVNRAEVRSNNYYYYRTKKTI